MGMLQCHAAVQPVRVPQMAFFSMWNVTSELFSPLQVSCNPSASSGSCLLMSSLRHALKESSKFRLSFFSDCHWLFFSFHEVANKSQEKLTIFSFSARERRRPACSARSKVRTQSVATWSDCLNHQRNSVMNTIGVLIPWCEDAAGYRRQMATR